MGWYADDHEEKKWANIDPYPYNRYSTPHYGANNMTFQSPAVTVPAAGSGGEDAGGVALLALGGLLYGAYKLVVYVAATLAGWAGMASPYREVAGFYYFGLVRPGEYALAGLGQLWCAAQAVWQYCTQPGLTSEANINLALGVVGEAVLIGLWLYVLAVCVEVWRTAWAEFDCLRVAAKVLAVAYLAPGLFIAAWSLWQRAA